MWTWIARTTKKGFCSSDLIEVKENEILPQGIPLYKCKHRARRAKQFINNYPQKPLPDELIPDETSR